MTNLPIKKQVDAFSFTEKIKDYLIHPDWQNGYDWILSGGDQSLDHTKGLASWYRFVSGGYEDVANKIYERVAFFAENVIDVDTCELLPLYSLAKMLDYQGNLKFLTYPYPKEVYELLSILSIKSSLLISNNNNFVLSSSVFKEILRDSTIPVPPVSDIYDASGNLIPTNEFSLYSDAQFKYGCENLFRDTLNTFLYLQYPSVGKPLTPPASGYIYQNTTLSADFDSDEELFSYKVNSDPEIFKLKIRLGVALDFNEVEIVDKIAANQDDPLNYTTTEQIVLNAELDRRSFLTERTVSVSRFNPEREKKVKEYFSFCENYVYSVFNNNILYNLNDRNNYIEIQKQPDYFKQFTKAYQIVDGVPTINTLLINDVAKELWNTALEISYLRDELKTLSRRYAIKGTFDAIKIAIKELFLKYVYGQGNDWRKYQNPFFTTIFNDLLNNLDNMTDADELDVKLLEYWDSTEYFNLNTNINYDALGFNDTEQDTLYSRYWENDLGYGETFSTIGSYGGDISKENIYEFYKNLRQKLREDSTVTDYLSGDISANDFSENFDYLEKLYAAGATSGIQNNTYSNISYPISSELSDVDFTDGSTVNINIFEYDFLSAYITYNENEIHPDSGRFNFVVTKTIKNDALLDNDTSVEATQYAVLEPNLLTGITYSGYSALNNLVTSEANDTYYFTGSLNTFSTQYLNNLFGGSTISGELVSTANYLDDGYNVWIKYQGGTEGRMPWANSKNKIHSSYALHPYLPRFIEVLNTINYSLKNIFIIVLKNIIYDIEYTRFGRQTNVLANRINELGEFGNTINSWRSDNIEYTGYQTEYEFAKNKNDNGSIDYKIDMDGPWNPLALSAFILSADLFSTNNILTSEYYSDIGLTDAEKVEIATKLDNHKTQIYDLSAKTIFEYGVDLFDNHYMLYKDSDLFDLTGEMWMRPKNHPLSLPLSAQISNVTLSSFGYLSSGINECYDFGLLGNWMWFAHAHPNGTNLYPRTCFVEIIKNNSTIEFRKETDKNIYTFTDSGAEVSGNTLSANNLIYVDIINSNEDLILVTVSGDETDSCILSSGTFTTNLYQFKPFLLQGQKLKNEVSRSISMNFNSKPYGSPEENIFRAGYNGAGLLTIGFESNVSAIGNIKNWWGVQSYVPLSALYVNSTTIIDSYDNGIGYAKINFYPEDEVYSIQEIKNSYPFTDVSYFPILCQSGDIVLNNLDTPFENDSSLANNISYNIQYITNDVSGDASGNPLVTGFVTTNQLQLCGSTVGMMIYYGNYDLYTQRYFEHRDAGSTDDLLKTYDLSASVEDELYVSEHYDDTGETTVAVIVESYNWPNYFIVPFTFIGQTRDTSYININGVNYKYTMTLVNDGKLNFKLVQV